MGRFLLLILAATSVARADSFASASCTYGSTTQTATQTGTQAGTNPTSASCTVPVNGMGGEVGVVTADAVTEGSVSGTLASINGDEKVVAQFDVPLNAKWSAIATLDDSLALATAGPKRAGFIQFDIRTISEAPGDVFISDGVHKYSYQQAIGTTTLPFNLGSAFQVSLSADEQIGGNNPPPPDFELADRGAHVSLSLLEANGTTAVPLVITPEPSTWSLLFLGLWGAWFRFSRRAIEDCC